MSLLSQTFPPKPTFTERDVPDLSGKVFLVTGSNTGVGKEIANILYSKNATIYIAARSEARAQSAISEIRDRNVESTGILKFLHLDLSDLTSCARTANVFLADESRLDGLFNNAGVLAPPEGSKTSQGYELQLGVNCLGHFLLAKKLIPLLQSTALITPNGHVRIVWVSSSAAENGGPEQGVPLDNLDYKNDKSSFYKYCVSKAGNYYQATEFAKRYHEDGIKSVALNPGNLSSDLACTTGVILGCVHRLISYPPKNGAYTAIYAAFSPDVTNGDWIIPFGRRGSVKKSLERGAKDESEGGDGTARRFWQWQEEQIKPYM
ncbi:unnamed protein product [Clonostachys rosea]|uniref:Short-chain dehydrogenase n=1 Tax=Bionectria ochroleuca TaxID=29856 RepID=A0ABY6UZF7_BIOOC|nr:unnamed protein product [Clonostachys rosea]